MAGGGMRRQVSVGATRDATKAAAWPSREHPMLQLQRRSGNGAVSGLLQRQVPARRDAGAGEFSRRVSRFTEAIVPAVRTSLGLDASATWDDEARAALQRLQDDAGVPTTGTVDDDGTLKWLVERMTIGRASTDATKVGACWLLADWFDMPVRPDTTFEYSKRLDSPGAIDPWSYEQRRARNGKGPMPPARILIGPMAFDQDLAGLVHTIRHELLHDEQHLRKVPSEVKETDPSQLDHRDEFEAEWLEMTDTTTVESVPGFADDALRAINRWDQMTAPNRRAMEPKFKAMLKMVEARLGGSAGSTHADIVRRWRDPAPAPAPIVRNSGPKEIVIHGAETDPDHHTP